MRLCGKYGNRISHSVHLHNKYINNWGDSPSSKIHKIRVWQYLCEGPRNAQGAQNEESRLSGVNCVKFLSYAPIGTAKLLLVFPLSGTGTFVTTDTYMHLVRAVMKIG